MLLEKWTNLTIVFCLQDYHLLWCIFPDTSTKQSLCNRPTSLQRDPSTLATPLERGGNWIDFLLGASPYSAPLSRLGKIRSAGITDLRHAYLLDEDWQGRDRFERSAGPRAALPLPEGMRCFAIAATTGKQVGDLKDRLIGDGLVPLASALGCHAERDRNLMFPPDRQWIALETGHLDLLSRAEVYACIRQWLEDA